MQQKAKEKAINQNITKKEEIVPRSDRTTIPKYSPIAYIIPVILIIICAIILVIAWTKGSIVISIIATCILAPIIILCLIVLGVKVYMDRKRIKNFTVTKLSVSKRFIIANIYTSNRRLRKEAYNIDQDSISFTDGKKTYVIDEECVWFDERNFPNLFYIENIPNPVRFAFQDNMGRYIQELLQSGLASKDNKGRMIDVSYSAENLQLLKKDKIFAELHKNPMMDKFLMIALGLVALAFVAIILIIIFNKPTCNTIIPEPATTSSTAIKNYPVQAGMFILFMIRRGKSWLKKKKN